MVEKMKCWCGGELAATDAHPDYLRCLFCKTFVSNSSLTLDQLKAYYGFENYWHKTVTQVYGQPPIEQRAEQDRYGRVKYWWDDIASKTAERGSLLEIGCCHGAFLSEARTNGFQYVAGVEPDEETCEFARKTFNLTDVYSGLWPDVYILKLFDVICGFDVLEHFRDPLYAMRAVCKQLNDNGIFMFQTPCYRGQENWDQFKPDEHLFIFSDASVAKLCQAAGLTCNIKQAIFDHDMVVWGHRK